MQIKQKDRMNYACRHMATCAWTLSRLGQILAADGLECLGGFPRRPGVHANKSLEQLSAVVGGVRRSLSVQKSTGINPKVVCFLVITCGIRRSVICAPIQS